MHLFVLATNPPTDHTSSFDHHNALTDLLGQGVYMQHEKYLYHFTCDESSCEWEIIQQQFGKSLYDPVMMYLPSSYGCSNSVTTTTTSPTTTAITTTTTMISSKNMNKFISYLISKTLVWTQWWGFVDVSQQGIDFSKKISKIKTFFDNFKIERLLFLKWCLIFDGPCEHLWKSNQNNILILLIFLLKSIPCWLTSVKLHHWGHTSL